MSSTSAKHNMINFCIEQKLGKKSEFQMGFEATILHDLGSNPIWSSDFFSEFLFDAKTYQLKQNKISQKPSYHTNERNNTKITTDEHKETNTKELCHGF